MPWSDGTPKYDLHRHFGGSISVETVTELLGNKCTVDEVRQLMVCEKGKRERSFGSFLSKFTVLNHIRWTEKALVQSIDQVVRDQASDAIDYSEMSFSINKYMEDSTIKWTRPELIKFIRDVFDDACQRWRTDVNLILALRMESDRYGQQANASLVRNTKVLDCMGGIDIVGDEGKFDAVFYSPIFRDWRDAGKLTLAHVGETRGVENVFDAITVLKAHRIRHGIAAGDDQEALAAARDTNTCFDVSLHSNMMAGTVHDLSFHHLPKLLAARCQATLGTDDPVIFGCNLEDEYLLGAQYGLFGNTTEEAERTVASLRKNSITFAGRKHRIY